jgi:hypothetical protein
VADENVPFTVLLDEDGAAAEAIEVNALGVKALIAPGQYVALARSIGSGKFQKKTGRRPLQLGATVVMGPPNEVLYIDREDYAGDHAPLDDVLKAATAGT